MDTKILQIPEDSKKDRLLLACGIASIVTFLFLLFYFNMASTTPDIQPSVRTTKVVVGDVSVDVKTYGKLKAKTRSGIIALTNGHIDSILLRPGATVVGGTEIVSLTNPKLQKDYQSSQLILLEELANVEKLKAELAQVFSQQKANIKLAEAQLSLVQVDLKANQQLRKTNVVSELKLEEVKMKYAREKTLLEIEKSKLATLSKTHESALTAASYRVKRAESQVEMLKLDLENLSLKSSMDGILLKLDENLEIGQQITEGQHIGTVVDSKSLYAELYVSASDADKLRFGQLAKLNIKGEVVIGKISRIAPTVSNGSIAIDVQFSEALPNSALPNIDVNGSIEIVKRNNVLTASRGAAVRKANSRQKLFVRPHDKSNFELKDVEIGAVDEDLMEIRSGAEPNAEILLKVPEHLSKKTIIALAEINE